MKTNIIYFKDAQNMTEVDDNSITLIITSPPYWCIKDYSKDGYQQEQRAERQPGQIGDISDYQEYLEALTAVWKDCERVLEPNGKLCINVPLMPILKKVLNTHHTRDIVNINSGIEHEILKHTGLYLMDVYIWNRTNPTKRLMFGCLPEQMLIYTPDGAMSIKDISVGQEVFIDTDKVGKVTHKYSSGIKPVYRLQTSNRELFTTEEHQVWGIYDKLCPSKHPKAYYSHQYQLGWHSVGELMAPHPKINFCYGHYLVMPTSLEVGDDTHLLSLLSAEGFESIDLDKFCRLLGVFLGDGWLSYNKGKLTKTINLCLYNEVASFYQRLIFEVFGFTCWSDKDGIKFASKRLARIFERLEFHHGALHKQIPPVIFRLPRSRRIEFLKGYLDADGSVGKYGELIYNTSSEQIKNALPMLLQSVGVFASNPIYHKPRVSSINQKEVKSQEGWAIKVAFKNGAPLLYTEFKNHQRNYHKVYDNYGYVRRRIKIPSGYRLEKILRSKYIGLHPTYDLSIDTDEKFLANGAIVHNSYPNPPNFYAQNTIEFVSVYVKDGRPRRRPDDIKDKSQLTQDEWVTLTKQIWDIPIPNKSDPAYGKHPAIMPEEMARRLIRLYSFYDDIVLDPFFGSGTTAKAAIELGRRWIGYELDPSFKEVIQAKLGVQFD